MREKTNAIEGEFHGFPPGIYDVEYKLSTVLERSYIDPDDNFEKDFLEYGYIQEFYTPELYWALHYGYFLRNDYERNCYVVDRFEFYHCYIDAFKAEKQDFDKKNANRQYPKNSEEYNFYIAYLSGHLEKCKFIFQNPDVITYHLCKKYGRFAGLFSQIIEIIRDDRNLQTRVKEIVNNDMILQERIIKLIPDISLQQSNETENKLICDKKLLQSLHAKFDDKVWESVELETFLNFMRVEPIGQIAPIKTKSTDKDFANWLHENIEPNRDFILVPNFGKWYNKLTGKKTNYSSKIAEH